MTNISLLASPGRSYLDTLVAALESADRFWLVTAFASPAGIDLLAPAIRRLLLRPNAQGQLVVAVDRRGFNATGIFEALLALKQEAGARLALGIVPEDSGLLHAKALLTSGPQATELIVGSANLTKSAFQENHELGVHLRGVPPDVHAAFTRFLTSLAPRPLDVATAAGVLAQRGLLAAAAPKTPAGPARGNAALRAAWQDLVAAVARNTPLAPPESLPDDEALQWARQGYLVGRGRRGTDALVIRLPLDALERRGWIRPSLRRALGSAARESRTLGFSIELIPLAEAELIRKEARRASLLLARLSLNLPCFGLWMPASYWDVFVAAREQLTSGDVLSHTRLESLAEAQRSYLLAGGLDESLAQILTSLRSEEAILAKDEALVLDAMRAHVEEALAYRTPDVIAEALEFRTARQQWTPYEQTDTPFRQLLVDVVQATFSATYRTGVWPASFRSFAAREIAASIASKLEEAGASADGALAMRLLDTAATWEDSARPFAEVFAEFRSFVPLDLQFEPPTVDHLLGEPAPDATDAAFSEPEDG